MRLISCHIENFGNISRADYEFGEGLNPFCEPNGYGKSTLAGFLKAMLYGMEGDRKNSAFNDRRRYAPFGGGTYGGSALFESGGHEYRIVRTFDGKSEKRDTLTVYRDGRACQDLGDCPGERLFGIDRGAFERTAFVSADDIRMEASDSIRSKLHGYVAGGDGQSVEKAKKTLEKAAKEYRNQRGGGLIRETEREIAAAEREIRELETLEKRTLPQEYADYAAAEKKEAEAEKRYREAAERQALLEKWQTYDGILSEAERHKAAAESLQAAHPAGFAPDEEADAAEKAISGCHEKRAALGEQRLFVWEELKLTDLERLFAGGVPDKDETEAAKAAMASRTEKKKELERTGLPAQDAEELSRLEAEFAHGVPSEGEISPAEEALEAKKRAEAALRFPALTEEEEDRLSRLENLYPAGMPSLEEISAAENALSCAKEKRKELERTGLPAQDAEELLSLQAEFAHGVPAEGEISAAEGDADKLRALESRISLSKEKATDAEAEAEKLLPSFGGRVPSEAECEGLRGSVRAYREAERGRAAGKSAAKESAANEEKVPGRGEKGKSSLPAWLIALAIVAAAAIVAGAVLCAFVAAAGIASLVLGVLLLAACAGLYIAGRKKAGRAAEGGREPAAKGAEGLSGSELLEREIRQALAQYGYGQDMPTDGGLDDAAEKFLREAERLQGLLRTKAEEEKKLESLNGEKKALQGELDAFFACFGISGRADGSLARLRSDIRRLEVLKKRESEEKERADRLREDMASAEGAISAFCEKYGIPGGEAGDRIPRLRPDSERLSELRGKKDGALLREAHLKEELANAEGTVRSLCGKYGIPEGEAERRIPLLRSDIRRLEDLKKRESEEKARADRLREDIASAERAISAFCKKYGIAAADADRRIGTLRTDRKDLLELREKKRQTEEKKARLTNELRAEEAKVSAFCEKYGIPADPSEGIPGRLKKLRDDGRQHRNEREEEAADRARAAQYKARNALTARPEGAPGDTEGLKESLSACRSERERLAQRIAEDESSAGTLGEKRNALEALRGRRDTLAEEHRILTAALDMLERADDGLTGRYLTPIRESFRRYADACGQAVGGMVVIGRDLDVSVDAGGQLRDEAHLSSGQRSVCALCFRLALIDSMYGEERPFLVLDDPFASLDGEHLESVRGLLEELSREVQIIYFCCHESRVMGD